MLDAQKDLQNAVIRRRAEREEGDEPPAEPQRAAQRRLRPGQKFDHDEHAQRDAHRRISLIRAHGHSQQQHRRHEPPLAAHGKLHGQHRHENGQTVGAGGEHIQKRVAQAGKCRHHGAAHAAETPAAHVQQTDRQRGRSAQQQHRQQPDDRRHLREAVEHTGVVKKPAAGHGHLLRVIHPAEPVGARDDIRKGVEVHQIPGDDARKKGRALRRLQPVPPPLCQFVQFHVVPPGIVDALL